MPSAEIITIGTEILLGEIVDTNARYLAEQLRATGIDLYRKTTVGDNINRIAQVIQEAFARCEIIITTGGLGPTIDDPTRDAVARAFGVELEFKPELWEQIKERFLRYNRQPTENNRRQAFIPYGATVIENPVGTAPAFMIEKDEKCIISLPGVPSEMKHLVQLSVLPFLRQRYRITTIIKTRTLHTAGIGESQIDDQIGDLETLSNPTVGLAAHSGQVDIRIVSKAETEDLAQQLIAGVEAELRTRLGKSVYGADKDSLEGIAMQVLQDRGWSLSVVEAGSNGELSQRLARLGSATFRGGYILNTKLIPEELASITDQYRQAGQAEVGLGLLVKPGAEQQQVYLVLITPSDQEYFFRPYGGPPEYTSRWAANISLDLIRKL
jgi:nicotinamide-nucleotide amidase